MIGSKIGVSAAPGPTWIASTSWAVVIDADKDPAAAVDGVAAWWGSVVPAAEWSPGSGSTTPAPIGLWVWPKGDASEAGTLEPLLDNVDGGPTATPGSDITALLDTHAPDGSKYTKDEDPIAHKAARIKARLAVHAQWSHPGSSWATWLSKDGLTKDFIDSSHELKALGVWLVDGLP